MTIIFFFCFSAIALHKFVIAFCVGLELCSSSPRLLIYSSYMVTFACMTPIGIGIGILITSQSLAGTTYLIVVAILQALGLIYSLSKKSEHSYYIAM